MRRFRFLGRRRRRRRSRWRTLFLFNRRRLFAFSLSGLVLRRFLVSLLLAIARLLLASRGCSLVGRRFQLLLFVGCGLLVLRALGLVGLRLVLRAWRLVELRVGFGRGHVLCRPGLPLLAARRRRRIGLFALRQGGVERLARGGALVALGLLALSFALLDRLLHLGRGEHIFGGRSALGLPLRLARGGDLFDLLRLGRRERGRLLIPLRFEHLDRLVLDLAGPFHLVCLGDVTLDDLGLCLLLDILDVDDLVHRHVVVDDLGVADGACALQERAPAVAVGDVVTRQIVGQEIARPHDRPVIVGHVADRDIDVDAPLTLRLRRQRRPCQIVVRLAPRYPGRRPAIARHPEPADAVGKAPSPIMIGRPAMGLVGGPGPAAIRIDPASARVGTPAAIDAGRDPDISALDPRPGSVRRQAVVELRIVDPALAVRLAPPRALAVERLVAIMGVPIGLDAEGGRLVAELRSVVAEQIVASLVIAREIDRPHPAAIILESGVAPCVVRQAAENGDRCVGGDGEDHGVLGPRPRAHVHIGDGIGIRFLRVPRRSGRDADGEREPPDAVPERSHGFPSWVLLQGPCA